MRATPDARRRTRKTAGPRGGGGVQTMEHTWDRRTRRISVLEVGAQVHVRVSSQNACTSQLLDPPGQVAVAEMDEMPLKRPGRAY